MTQHTNVTSPHIRRAPVSMTKVGPKHQVTIPRDVFEQLRLDVGDYLDVQVRGNTITMVPAKLIPKEDAWFYTPEWQAKERQADEAIAKGNVSGPFTSAKDLIAHLEKRSKRARKT